MYCVHMPIRHLAAILSLVVRFPWTETSSLFAREVVVNCGSHNVTCCVAGSVAFLEGFWYLA